MAPSIQLENQPQLPEPHVNCGKKKSLSFWLSFVALNITVFIVSLDSTALAVAIPVQHTQIFCAYTLTEPMLISLHDLENNTGPARHNARSILDQPFLYSSNRHYAAHLHHHVRCLRSQDPLVCRLPLLLRWVYCFRRCELHASLDRRPHTAGFGWRWVGCLK